MQNVEKTKLKKKIRKEEIRKFGNSQERSGMKSDKKGTDNIGLVTLWSP